MIAVCSQMKWSNKINYYANHQMNIELITNCEKSERNYFLCYNSYSYSTFVIASSWTTHFVHLVADRIHSLATIGLFRKRPHLHLKNKTGNVNLVIFSLYFTCKNIILCSFSFVCIVFRLQYCAKTVLNVCRCVCYIECDLKKLLMVAVWYTWLQSFLIKIWKNIENCLILNLTVHRTNYQTSSFNFGK